MRLMLPLVLLFAGPAFAQDSPYPSPTDRHGPNPATDRGPNPNGHDPDQERGTIPPAPIDNKDLAGKPNTTTNNDLAGKPDTSGLSQADATFVREAAQANHAEIELGQLAVTRGSTAKIRKMGQSLLDDHKKVGERLSSIVTPKGVTLPPELSVEQKATVDRLSTLSGTEFDSAYIDEMKEAHQQAINLFQEEAKNGADPQIKSFAKSTLPSLRHHQKMVLRSSAKM